MTRKLLPMEDVPSGRIPDAERYLGVPASRWADDDQDPDAALQRLWAQYALRAVDLAFDDALAEAQTLSIRALSAALEVSDDAADPTAMEGTG